MSPTKRPFVWRACAVGCLALASIRGAGAEPPTATTPPSFTESTTFTNPYFPFTVGDVKVYRGKDGKKRIAATEHHLADTRSVAYDGALVITRVVREIEFRNGKVLEVSQNFYAQADDGSVWLFGEVVDEYESGIVVGHDGSWLVGGPPLPSDPTDIVIVGAPALTIPNESSLSVGFSFDPEGLPGIEEVATIEKIGGTIEVEAGVFDEVIRIKETADDEPGFERKWLAFGVGLVRQKDGGETLELIATTQAPPAIPPKQGAVEADRIRTEPLPPRPGDLVGAGATPESR